MTKRFVKPTVKEVTEYMTVVHTAKGYGNVLLVQELPEIAEDFIDYYESIGWVIGKSIPMVSWRHSANHWLRNAIRFNKQRLKNEYNFKKPSVVINRDEGGKTFRQRELERKFINGERI